MPTAPIKTRIETIVEKAPSHDGSPTFAAYDRQPAERSTRPLWTHRIYDTTAQAADPRHVSYVARVVHENTHAARENEGSSDRIEVIGLPMLSNATDEQRATKCREHHIAEINSRNEAKQKDWYIPSTFEHDSYLRAIFIICRFGEGWEQIIKRRPHDTCFSYKKPQVARKYPYGTYLLVFWKKGDKIILEEDEEPWPDVSINVHEIISLDCSLRGRQENASWFEHGYVPQGMLEKELGLE